jgi:hypothetical protein
MLVVLVGLVLTAVLVSQLGQRASLHPELGTL